MKRKIDGVQSVDVSLSRGRTCLAVEIRMQSNYLSTDFPRQQLGFIHASDNISPDILCFHSFRFVSVRPITALSLFKMDWETFLLGHVEKAERIHQRSTNSALPALGHAAAPMHPSRQSDREVLAIAKISKPPGSRDTAVTATRNADTKSWVRLE
jgi:hypothetical protein